MLALLASYLLLSALVAFWLIPIDKALAPKLVLLIERAQKHGVPAWLGYDQIQFGANILFFIPLTFLLACLVGRHFWGLAALLGLAASVAVEFVQGEFLTERFSSVADVAANATGSVIGALLARWWLGRRGD